MLKNVKQSTKDRNYEKTLPFEHASALRRGSIATWIKSRFHCDPRQLIRQIQFFRKTFLHIDKYGRDSFR